MNRLLFLINTLNGGGAEKVLVNLANGLCKKGYDVSIQTLTEGINRANFHDKVKVRTLVKGNMTHLKDFAVCLFCKLLPFRIQSKILLRGKFDTKVAYLEGYPTKILKYDKSGARLLAYVHSDLSKGYTLNKIYANKSHCLDEYSAFQGVAFVSKVAQDGFFKEIGPLMNSRVVYNVMDFDDILTKSKEPTEIKFHDNTFKLIAVGRLSYPKSFDRLIKVIHRLNDNNVNTELFILGEGTLEQELKKLARELNCENIKFLGYDKNPYRYMAKADLMICSSLYEGYSTTTVEAMLLGLPVITTDCAGMAEILDNGKYGVIVENQEDALFEGLYSLLKSPENLSELKNRVSERSQQLKSDKSLIQNINFLENVSNA